MPQDPGFDRGRAERCELAQDRQIPPTRCRAAGPTLHPLAPEPDYERGVLSVSALCISVQQSTPRQGRQMQEVRKTLILRPVASGSMQHRRRDWWWRVPSVCSFGCLSTSKRRRKILAVPFMQRVISSQYLARACGDDAGWLRGRRIAKQAPWSEDSVSMSPP